MTGSATVRMWSGSAFQVTGPAWENARSPNFVRKLFIHRLFGFRQWESVIIAMSAPNRNLPRPQSVFMCFKWCSMLDHSQVASLYVKSSASLNSSKSSYNTKGMESWRQNIYTLSLNYSKDIRLLGRLSFLLFSQNSAEQIPSWTSDQIPLVSTCGLFWIYYCYWFIVEVNLRQKVNKAFHAAYKTPE